MGSIVSDSFVRNVVKYESAEPLNAFRVSMWRHCSNNLDHLWVGLQSFVYYQVPGTLGSGVAEWARELTGQWFESRCGKNFSLRFGTLAIPFTPPCQCLSDETLNLLL